MFRDPVRRTPHWPSDGQSGSNPNYAPGTTISLQKPVALAAFFRVVAQVVCGCAR
jgi:hypothetical protein